MGDSVIPGHHEGSELYDQPEYKLWHIPQVPMTPFEVESDDLQYLAWLQDVLAAYDDWQYENQIKPNSASASGIAYLDDDGEWSDIDDEEIGSLRETFGVQS